MSRRFAVLSAALAVGVLVAPGAWAQSLVNARVLGATPVYQAVPVTQCAPAYAQTSGAGAFIGSVLGAALGSQFGSGGGHFAGAAVGAVGGALLGNAAEAQQEGAYGGCQTVYQQRLTGYDVSYELGGQTYQTRTAQAPGAWITVPVAAGYSPSSDPAAVQTYPVTAPPMAKYPLPAPVVSAPPAYAPGYASGYAPAYPQPYTTPVGVPVYVRPAPVYPAYPVFVAPVGVNLSVGGGWGRHGRGGWGLSVGSGW